MSIDSITVVSCVPTVSTLRIFVCVEHRLNMVQLIKIDMHKLSKIMIDY
jgi:hypothetical protein